MSELIEKFNDRGYLIYSKHPNGKESWIEYDKNDAITCIKNTEGYEYHLNVYEGHSLVYLKNSKGIEFWYKLNSIEERRIPITRQEFEKIKEQEFLSREEVSIFELMDL